MPKFRLGHIILLAPLLVMLTAGCRRAAKVSNEPDSRSQPSTESNAAVGAVETTLDSLAPPAIAENPPGTGDLTQRNTATILDSLTQSVRKYAVEQRRQPKSIEEVVRAGYIAGLPDPPGGKKLALDLKSMRVVLVDR